MNLLDEVPAVAEAQAAPTRTLLTVDDEPSVLSALRRLFRGGGYRILQAGSGAEALRMLGEERVDLVLSDMRMPEMDGTQLLEAVRLRDPSIMRVLLTGYSDIGSTIAAINRGEIHRYVAKPWDDQDLLLIVRDALARRDLERENLRLGDLAQQQNDELRELNRTLEARVASRTAEIEQINSMLEAAYEEVNQQFMLAVEMFTALLEARADRIAGHSRRVGQLTQRIAEKMGIMGTPQRNMYLAGLLHDVGKIGFPDAMFKKPAGAYTVQEQEFYRKHPLDGEAALMPLDKLQDVALMVRQHHERWDGRGFPDGLRGEDITLGARIISLASDFAGLVSGDLGQEPMEPIVAALTTKNLSGQRYDPKVIRAFEAVLADEAKEALDDVEIEVTELLSGMVLSRDLLSSRGAVLLTAGYTFNARVISQVTEFARREGLVLKLFIRTSSMRNRPAKPAARST